MGRSVDKLTTLKVRQLTRPGLHSDGNGLYLQLTSSGTKSWIFRFQRAGKERQMGLGSFQDVSLLQARLKARQARDLVLSGIDPIELRQAERWSQRLSAMKEMNFETCARRHIESHASSWTSDKHRQQWERTLTQYASPVFGKLPVRKIETSLVLKVLSPIWATKTETASRVRERIERVLSWAAIHGYREGDNPARWKGHLEEMLPKPTKVKKVVHHAALPFQEVPAFFKCLRAQEGVAARALELTILTACRTSEVIDAAWSELDLAAGIWTIPAERMKAGKAHRVPLSAEVVGLLNDLKGRHPTWLFPGARVDKPLSNMAMLSLLKRMNRADITVHGFRSTFRDWVSEATPFPGEVAEMALAHAIQSAVESAYRRGDLFEKRRELMRDWGRYCLGVGGGGEDPRVSSGEGAMPA